MLVSCSYCMGLHKRGEECPNKKEIKRYRNRDYDKNVRHGRDKQYTDFYNSTPWRKKSERIKQRDNYLCQVCIRGLYGTTLKYNYHNIQVHHVDPIKENWNSRLDDDILISLCALHHPMAESGKIPREELLEIIKEQEEKYMR